MQDRGYNRDAQQCRVKIKELRQAYQRTRDANGHSGSEPQTCRFYDELHAILGGAASTDPPMWYDSVCGSSETTEKHFRGEEDDDNDDQNSTQTQQGSGEALFPDSQELFVTLEPVPSEPTQGVLDAGEGTSAANVSTPPPSSPSQRLAKIRSKKKRNRDDMFSELMESSHTEAVQQNAWRQTLSESRKAEFDREERWRDEESRWRQRAERRQDAILRLLEDQTEILRLMAEERHRVQERPPEPRPPLQPLCNQQPSFPSPITSSPRRPRTRLGGLRTPNHSSQENSPSKKGLAFNKF
ncbi:uncharacterized protein RBU57_001742 isoform 1-T1 [Macrochelys suwanniensis]